MQWAISQLKKRWPNPWPLDTLLDAIKTLVKWEIIKATLGPGILIQEFYIFLAVSKIVLFCDNSNLTEEKYS